MKHFLFFISFLSLSLEALACMPQVSFITPDIVRVNRSSDGSLKDNNTGACVYRGDKVETTTQKIPDGIEITSGSLTVRIKESNGAVTFIGKETGKVIFSENPECPYEQRDVADIRTIYDDATAHAEDTANGKVTVRDIIGTDTLGTRQWMALNFLVDANESLYGLGSHMEDYLDLVGKTVYLTQHNLKIAIPMLVSSSGYGLLFDAGCAMQFSSGEKQSGMIAGRMELDDADALDYYFIRGKDMQDVAGSYRLLTGDVSLPPRYMFGYIQSKERYVSSDDIINTVKEYRKREVPLDMIVQDWNYWPEGWGYMKMNPEFYPDPRALADSVHALDARIMISIWPNPQYCPQFDDFNNRGFMLQHSVYDAFNPEARDLYWKYADREFFSKGFDAWWCDSSEPLDGDWNRMPEPVGSRPYSWDDHERRWNLNKQILSEALGSKRTNLYSLYHSKGIYENQRKKSDQKRVVNLTRSSFPGQQRYGTIVWNGDTHASWESFRQQIPSGLNYMATGNPYWTVDIGCFFTRSDPRWFYKGEFPDGVKDDNYKEFYTRMLQWATFLPVMRSHGSDTPREIWNFGEKGEPFYDAILKMINLRYSLIPYIYSMAARQSFGNYSMARMLPFDFPDDPEVRDIKDQYMFGDLMVCPVTSPGISSRKVYLPVTDDGRKWIDCNSGEKYDGGSIINADSPLDIIPLFIREGSIIPTTLPVQSTSLLKGEPITINICPGADADFLLYDDDGDNYNYEKGDFSFTRLEWNDNEKWLKICPSLENPGKREVNQKFIIKTPDNIREVNYKGIPLKISL